jgi:agmatine deiminase
MIRTSLPLLPLLVALFPALVSAQEMPVVPEGTPLPRSLTDAEAEYLKEHPLTVDYRAVTAPPAGPIHCVAEYEPMDGIIVAWEGYSTWTTVLAKLAAQITTTGDADFYVAVDSASEGSSALSAISAQGADMARVHTMVVSTDTIWLRDYGPRYIYQGDVRCIIDHTYNRPRPNDNRFSGFFAGQRGHAIYELPLIHGGGNYHLDAVDRSYTSRLINDENPGLTEQQIHDIWWDFQHVDTNFFEPLPSYIDSTQHIDMWMQVIGDHEVLISDWPLQSGTAQDQRCDTGAAYMAGLGFTVHRIPAHSTGGTHYTFTNSVMCNDLVIIPSYTNSTIVPLNSQALAVWQAACPTKTIVQMDGQPLVTSAGVFHCIVMHLPEHKGGVDPTGYLIAPDGGENCVPGSTITIEWLSDDDVAATTVDLLLSTDGGVTFPTSIATALPAMGSYDWMVPGVSTTEARVRVVVHDGAGNSGFDDSDGDFTISTSDLAAVFPYGSGKPGTLGVPLLDTPDLPVIGGLFTLEVSRARPGGDAIYIYGVNSSNGSFDGTSLLVDYFGTLTLPLDGTGAASLPLSIPPNPALAGLSFYWQAWIPNDPNAAGMGWAASNGLQTRLGF